jgi:hypothetical protein
MKLELLGERLAQVLIIIDQKDGLRRCHG